MKTCPTCGNSYNDDLSFCLQDGTRLPGSTTFELTNSPTEVYQPKTNKNTDISTAETIVSDSNLISTPPKQFQMSAVEPSRRMGCVLTIGQVAAGLLVVVGLGLVGVYYNFNAKKFDVARIETPSNQTNPVNTNTASNSGANTAANATKPVPSTTANVTKTDHSPAANVIKTTPLPAATPIRSIAPPIVTRPPRTVSGGLLNGKAISLPKPSYPPAARAVSASGSVSVQVLIDENGSVISANAVSGHPLLQAAAVQAARSARFSPTLLGGQAVKVSGVIVYNFVL